jgi:hypothetical protein
MKDILWAVDNFPMKHLDDKTLKIKSEIPLSTIIKVLGSYIGASLVYYDTMWLNCERGDAHWVFYSEGFEYTASRLRKQIDENAIGLGYIFGTKVIDDERRAKKMLQYWDTINVNTNWMKVFWHHHHKNSYKDSYARL